MVRRKTGLHHWRRRIRTRGRKSLRRARTSDHDRRAQRRSRRRLGAGAVLSRRANAKPEGSLSLHRQGDADSYPEWPKGPQVHAYLTEYAKDNNLLGAIRFNTAVAQMNRRPDSEPRLAARSARAGWRRPSRGLRFRRGLYRAVQRAPDAQPARRRHFQGAGRAHPALLAIQRSGHRQRPQGRRARRFEVGDGHCGQRGQFRRRRSDAGVPRAGMADSLFHRRPGQFQTHSLHPRAGGDVPQLGHRRDVAVRACGRKAVRLGQLARTGEPAESSAQARQVRHGAEGADRGWRQLLGADRNPRILSDGRRRPHQGYQRQL